MGKVGTEASGLQFVQSRGTIAPGRTISFTATRESPLWVTLHSVAEANNATAEIKLNGTDVTRQVTPPTKEGWVNNCSASAALLLKAGDVVSMRINSEATKGNWTALSTEKVAFR